MNWLRMCVTGLLLIGLLAGTASAGIRGPGKYCGMVFFDRWDACYLYSGIYLMYVSEKTKEGLRQYAGQWVQIDAKEVYQPINPGDGRIGKYGYVGPALEPTGINVPYDYSIEGLRLRAVPIIADDKKLKIKAEIINEGQVQTKLFSMYLAPTLFTTRSGSRDLWDLPDGRSKAFITRAALGAAGEEAREWRQEFVTSGRYYWAMEQPPRLPLEFLVEAGASTTITFAPGLALPLPASISSLLAPHSAFCAIPGLFLARQGHLAALPGAAVYAVYVEFYCYALISDFVEGGAHPF